MENQISRRYLRYAEYGLLVIIIGLIVLFFFHRVGTVHKQAERMSLLGEINSMRGGVAAAIEEPPFDPDWHGSRQNPLRILQDPPQDYQGIVRAPEQDRLPQRSWYFCPEREMLVYKARFSHDLPFTAAQVRCLGFRLQKDCSGREDTEGRVLSAGPVYCLTVYSDICDS